MAKSLGTMTVTVKLDARERRELEDLRAEVTAKDMEIAELKERLREAKVEIKALPKCRRPEGARMCPAHRPCKRHPCDREVCRCD